LFSPLVNASDHQNVYGFIEYSDGSWIPTDVIVTLTNVVEVESTTVMTFTADSGHTGYYHLDVYDIDGEDGHTINVSVSYGGCTGYSLVNVDTSQGPSIINNVTISGNLPPAIPSQPSGNSSGYTGAIYTFSTSTTDPEEDQIYYMFDWGDGTYSSWLGPYNSSITVNTSNVWSSSGEYDVRVKAKDTYGASSGVEWSDPLLITIDQSSTNMDPIAGFTYEPTTPLINIAVNFTDTSVDYDGSIVNWTWEFGDGNVNYTQNPSYIYNQTGAYLVNLTVMDNQNATNTKQQTITVTTDTPPTNVSWEETTEITLRYNEKNKGNNYLVWKGAAINASVIAENISLSSGESISIFNKTDGLWQSYTVGVSNISTDDFLVSPWDVIIIYCKSEKKISMDTSHQSDASQSIVISYFKDIQNQTSNEGYNFFVWTGIQTKPIKEFIGLYELSGEDVEISAYDTDSHTWYTYNPSLPSVFNNDFDIQLYNIICIKVAERSEEHIITIS